MKTFPIVILLSLLFSLETFAQANTQQEVPLDTIVFISKRKIVGKVQRVTTSIITYFPKGKNKTEELSRRQIHKIYYSNGKTEFFNSLAVEDVAEDDWKTVILSDNSADVEGLYPLGKVDAQSSPKSRTAKSAMNSADIRLKKKAINMGGIIVLITKREAKGGYNEIPTHYVEGVVYGFEPPAQTPGKP
jgi:hypothetical protein